jgi:hypothetical protein
MSTSVTSSLATYRAGQTETGKAYIAGAVTLPVVTAVAASGAVTWSDNGAGGVFTGTNPATYRPANRTRLVTISATDAVNTHSVSIQVYASIPLNPTKGYSIDTDNDTKRDDAKDKTPVFFERGPLFRSRPVAWANRSLYQMTLLDTFFQFHRKVIELYYVDLETGEILLTRFDSGLRIIVNGAGKFDMSATIRGRL